MLHVPSLVAGERLEHVAVEPADSVGSGGEPQVAVLVLHNMLHLESRQALADAVGACRLALGDAPGSIRRSSSYPRADRRRWPSHLGQVGGSDSHRTVVGAQRPQKGREA